MPRVKNRAAFLLLQLHRRWQNPRAGISLRQFEQMKERLGGKSPRETLPFAVALRQSEGAAAHKIILGVDPSLRGTGFGIIQLAKPFPETLAHGTISCPKNWERSRCFAKISESLALGN